MRKHLKSETISEISTDCRVVEKRSLHNGRITKEIIFKDSEIERHYSESVALYTKEELEEMIMEAGLQPLGCYGDYLGNDWHAESERTVIFAQRKA